MVEPAVVERVLCVVDRCLRSQFPDDYYKRCLYASFGVHRLLQAQGYSPVIVGGNFGPLLYHEINELLRSKGTHPALASIPTIGSS